MRFAPLVPKPKPSSQGNRKVQRKPSANFATAPIGVCTPLTDPSTNQPLEPESYWADRSGFRNSAAQWAARHEIPPIGFMAKLEVGDANDPLEREADAIADRVMRMSSPHFDLSHLVPPFDAEVEPESESEEELTEAPVVSGFAGGAALPNGPGFVAHRQCSRCEDDELHRAVDEDKHGEIDELRRACASCETDEELRRACASCDADEDIQRACVSCATDEELQRACANCDVEDEEVRREAAASRRGGTASDDFTARVRSLVRAGGRPLPLQARSFLEPRLGVDLEHLRVHTDAQAGLLTQRINARAFTLGNDVFFAPGEWRPQTHSGMRLLAHEVAHTLQGSDKFSETEQSGTPRTSQIHRTIFFDVEWYGQPVDVCNHGLPPESIEDELGLNNWLGETEEDRVEYGESDDTAPTALPPGCAPNLDSPSEDADSLFSTLRSALAEPSKTDSCGSLLYESPELASDAADIFAGAHYYDPTSIPPPPDAATGSSVDSFAVDRPNLIPEGLATSWQQLDAQGSKLAEVQERAIEAAAASILIAQDVITLSTEDQIAKCDDEIDAWGEWGEERMGEIVSWRKAVSDDIWTDSVNHINWLEKQATFISRSANDAQDNVSSSLDHNLDYEVIPAVDHEVVLLMEDVDLAVLWYTEVLWPNELSEKERQKIYDWKTKKHYAIYQHGEDYKAAIETRVYQLLCWTTYEIEGQFSTMMSNLGDTAEGFLVAAEAALQATDERAHTYCATIGSAVDAAHSSLGDHRNGIINASLDLLDEVPEYLLEARDTIVAQAESGRVAVRDLQDYITWAAGSRSGQITDALLVDEIEHLFSVLSKGVRELDDATGVLEAFGEDFAWGLFAATASDIKDINENAKSRDVITLRLSSMLADGAELARCFRSMRKVSHDETEAMVMAFRTLLEDALGPFMANEISETFSVQFRTGVEAEEKFGDRKLGLYVGLLELIQQRIDAVRNPAKQVGKVALGVLIALVEVAAVVVAALALGVPASLLAVIAVVTLALGAIFLYAGKRMDGKSRLDAAQETVAELLLIPQIVEELERAEPDYVRVGQLATESILTITVALSSVPLASRSIAAVRFSRKVTALEARIVLLEAKVPANSSLGKAIGGVRRRLATLRSGGSEAELASEKIDEAVRALELLSKDLAGALDSEAMTPLRDILASDPALDINSIFDVFLRELQAEELLVAVIENRGLSRDNVNLRQFIATNRKHQTLRQAVEALEELPEEMLSPFRSSEVTSQGRSHGDVDSFEWRYGGSEIYAQLDQGGLFVFSIRAKEGAAVRGKLLFDMAIRYFGVERVQRIEGHWVSKDNIARFNEYVFRKTPAKLRARGEWPEQIQLDAAKSATFTGDRATHWGFTAVKMEHATPTRAAWRPDPNLLSEYLADPVGFKAANKKGLRELFEHYPFSSARFYFTRPS